MNNESNSNNDYNGQVLGSLNNNIVNMPPDGIETLELDDNMVNSSSLNNNMSNLTANVENNVSVTPEPAYTNPKTINLTSAFENSKTIGTTPPISLEPEKKFRKKKNNKTLFVIIVIILLFGVGFGTYYILKYTNLLNSKSKIEINIKNLEINVEDELSTNITDYADIYGTDVKNCVLSTKDVDVNVEGIYTFDITCGDINKKGEIKVIDNKELEVETEKVYKVKGDTINANEFILNPKNNYNYEILNKEEVDSYLNSNPGKYQVKIKVTKGTRVKEIEETLVILEYKINGYLICSSKEQNLNDSSTKKVVSNKFVLLNDSNFSFSNIAYETYEFKFFDEMEYTSYLAKYKTDGSIIIDNVTGEVEFNNDSLIISITNELNEDEIKEKFNGNNLPNYSSIKRYFINTLGYDCTYKKETQN